MLRTWLLRVLVVASVVTAVWPWYGAGLSLLLLGVIAGSVTVESWRARRVVAGAAAALSGPTQGWARKYALFYVSPMAARGWASVCKWAAVCAGLLAVVLAARGVFFLSPRLWLLAPMMLGAGLGCLAAAGRLDPTSLLNEEGTEGHQALHAEASRVLSRLSLP